jgi:hypothetical protein
MGVLPDEPVPKQKPSQFIIAANITENLDTKEWPYFPRLNKYGPQGHLSMRGIKLFADGALGSFGAALLEPYSDDPSTSGLMRTSPEALKTQVEALYARGWQTVRLRHPLANNEINHCSEYSLHRRPCK